MTAAAGAAALTGFVGVPSFEAALLGELGGGKPDGPRWPGVVTTRRPVAALDPAFALQRLPAATQVVGESVNDLANAADIVLGDQLDAHEGPIWLHVYVPDRFAYRTVAGRAALLETAFAKLLGERRRRVSKRLVKVAAQAGVAEAQFAQCLLVQLVLVGRSSLLVSAACPRPLPQGGFDVAPFVAGSAAVAEDKTAPSRAYRKLVEGFAWLGREPRAGETCVDLGGAPGGWAYTALTRGASVIAVDRSPLAPPAAGHPQLAMITGNAFTYRPPAPVDWLLCDVICEPRKTIDLVERWVDAGLCRFINATLKFKGATDYPAIEEARQRLQKKRWPFLRIKHLVNHSNEAVLLLRRDG